MRFPIVAELTFSETVTNQLTAASRIEPASA